jgi:hypothetical protein
MKAQTRVRGNERFTAWWAAALAVVLAVVEGRGEPQPDPPYRGKILLFGAVSATNKEVKPANVQAIRPDGSGLEVVLAFDGASIWAGRASPDGRSLAVQVAAKDVGRSVWLVGPRGERRKLADDVYVQAWSPDGTSLACYREKRDGGFESLVLDAATGKERRLPVPKEDVVEGWTPDGSRMVVVAGNRERMIDTPRGRYPRRQMYLCKPDGTDRGELTPEEKFDQLEASYSPDGKRVAHFRRENPDVHKVLHSGVIRDADGTGAREYVQFDTLIDSLNKGYVGKPHCGPCWSPDGKEVLWVVWRYKRTSRESGAFYDLVFTSPEKGYERRIELYEKGIVAVGNVEWR